MSNVVTVLRAFAMALSKFSFILALTFLKLVREITYKYEDWRNYAAEKSEPVLDEAIRTVNASLADFYGMVAEDYLEHLNLLIEQQSKTKRGLVDDFSDDEQKLQKDNDWFTSFQEKLLEIERG